MSGTHSEWASNQVQLVDQHSRRHSHRPKHSDQHQEQQPSFTFNAQSQEDVNNFMNYLQQQQQHHRQHDNLKESKDANQQQQFFDSSKQFLFASLPFVILALIKVGCEHSTGIFIFLFSQVTFSHCNNLAKDITFSQQLKNKRRWSLDVVLACTILVLAITLISLAFSDQKLYRSFYLMPVSMEMGDVWSLVWVVLLNDFTLMFATVLVKLLVCHLVPNFLLFSKKKGQWCQLIEYTSQSYRRMVPITPWVYFLLVGGMDKSSSWLSIILFVVYVVFKSLDLYKKGLELKNVFLLFLFSQSLRQTSDHVAMNGGACAICHHAFQLPVTLACGHTYCDQCIEGWLDRERNCPLCGQKVHDHPTWRDGGTSGMTQFF